jgi:folate-dependent phosphoribosylglycinamide formyltransferase PurN
VTRPLRVAWLTTGRGPGSFGAFEYVLGEIGRGLPVEVAVLFINRDRGEAEPTDRLIGFAEDRGIPVETLSSVRFRKERGGNRSRPGEPLPAWRHEYDEEVAARLGRYEFELGVLFGYMLIATPALFKRFPLINDHPALPDGPVGTYQDVIRELIRSGARESGCLMNVVTGDLDRGPVISWCSFPIRDAQNEALWRDNAVGEASDDSPLFQDIRARGVARERPFLAETLRAIAERRLFVPPESPLDLTEQVETRITDAQRQRAGGAV